MLKYIFLPLFLSILSLNVYGSEVNKFSSHNILLVTDIISPVEVSSGGELKAIKKGDFISCNDKIKTSEGGKIKLISEDGSVIKLSENGEIEIQKSDVIILNKGKLWGNIKKNIDVVTDSGKASVTNGEFEITADRDATILTNIKGNTEFYNDCGKAICYENISYMTDKNSLPKEIKKLTGNEISEHLKWTDFGNPRVMVLIEELSLDKKILSSSMESSINSNLSDAHYHLIDPGQIDIIRKSDEAKKVLSGDLLAASTLGKRLKSDIIITGNVETEYVGQMTVSGNIIVTCQARCDIRVIIADTAQIIVSKKLTEKATSLSKEEASKKAIDKIADRIAKELLYDIPVNYTMSGNTQRAMELVIFNCDFTSRDKFITFLKSIPEIGEKVYPRTFENSIAIIDIEYKGTSEELAKEIMTEFKIDITAITMNKLEIKISK
jgi:hypothetical protein